MAQDAQSTARSGRAGPPRRPRQQTETLKSHRYEPFNKRIAKLKIDPVHKVQHGRLAESAGDNLQSSHFRTALDDWSELNLTATFTSFYNRVHAQSESLPQLLHHSETIIHALLEHIEKQESLSLEALLSLVAHLAHDLGPEFEKYFLPTVSLVAKVAAEQEDPAIVEACFTCLTWIYKYLSRLLIKNPVPLLDELFPYFAARKDYIRRFTAESLAFLLRKAAATYRKNPQPLTCALQHLLVEKLRHVSQKNRAAFSNSCMILLTETSTGVDAGLHSCLTDLFNCLIDIATFPEADNECLSDILSGFAVSLVHKTDAQGCKPLQEVILTHFAASKPKILSETLFARLVLVLTATRGGSRVTNWSRLLSELCAKFAALAHTDSRIHQQVLVLYCKIAVAAIANAPLDQILSSSTAINQHLQSGVSSPHEYFSYCEAVARLNKGRFQDLVLPHLQVYIEQSWTRDTSALTVLCDNLTDLQCIGSAAATSTHIAVGVEWENTLLKSLVSPQDLNLDVLLQSLLLHRSLRFPTRSQSQQILQTVLANELQRVLNQKIADQLQDRVALGAGFRALLDISSQSKQGVKVDLANIIHFPDNIFGLLPFVDSILTATQQSHDSLLLSKDQVQVFIPKLCRNLLNSSLQLRKASLTLLRQCDSTSKMNPWLSSTIDLLCEIVDTDYTIANARKLAMLVRRLPQIQSAVPSHSTFTLLIPSFTMGLLQDYHDQLRSDLAQVLSVMAQDTLVETFVLETFQEWLQSPKSVSPRPSQQSDELPSQVSTFECTRLSELQRTYHSVQSHFSNPLDEIRSRFEAAHDYKALRLPSEARLIALEVLTKMPALAEKRSKILVPSFLSANKARSGHDPSLLMDSSNSVNTLSPDIEEHSWTQKERKLFLQLLGQFNNPRVLYRADDVRSLLLELLTNGDSTIRTLALSALLRWKDRSLLAHQETLLQIAEDKKTTSEIAILLNPPLEADSNSVKTRAELLQVVLRLILGQLISRAGTHGSQEAKRKALLRPIFRMAEEEITMFLDLVLGPLKAVNVRDEESCAATCDFNYDIIQPDQQYGFLRMVMSMLDVLQLQFAPHGLQIIDAILYCIARAEHIVKLSDEDAPALVKTIRRSGISCLNTLLEYCVDLDVGLYVQFMWTHIIYPRMDAFLTENTQGVSGLLTLFSELSKNSTGRSLLIMQDNKILLACCHLLSSTLSKPAVKIFILEKIIQPLLEMEDGNTSELKRQLNAGNFSNELLTGLGQILQQNPTKELLLSTTSIIQTIARRGIDEQNVASLTKLMLDALKEPNQRLAPHVKSQILKALDALISAHRANIISVHREVLLSLLAEYLDFFKDTANRQLCLDLLTKVCEDTEQLLLMTKICRQLNASSSSSLNEMDLDAQSTAFTTIHEILKDTPPEQALLPITNNLIFIIRTTEDTASRGNALGCLKHMARSIAPMLDEYANVTRTILAAIRKHISHESETTRADFLELLGIVVQFWHHEASLLELEKLTFGHDEEASFFINILHIQQHRRTRAMRRCVTEIQTGSLSAETIAGYILPIFQKFVLDDSTTESAQATKGQALISLVPILQWLDWKTFRRVFKQYRQVIEQKDKDQKIDVRLLSQATDALTAARNLKVEEVMTDDDLQVCHLAATLPGNETLARELTTHFIPKLAELSHFKDEGEVSERLPAAVVAIKLIKLLPEDQVPQLSTSIVLDMAQILRSRTQEVRDLARRKLADVVVLLGSSCIQFVVKQLRTVLTRGYQLHVLSYTMHSILLATAEQRDLGELDYCLEDLVKVIFDDTFGVTGQEKENADYTSSMKEVKGSKSFDSMEILAKCTSVGHLLKLVSPFQTLLEGNLTSKQVKHVDELFRRIGVGISHSPAASSQDLLVFAFETIKAFYKAKTALAPRTMTNDERNRDRFIVQKDNTSRVGTVTSTSLQYKSVKFAIDIARSTFARHSDLMTPANVHGFIPVIGDALLEAKEDVKISAMRLLATVVRLNMPELADHARLHVIEAVKVVKAATSTNEEAAQAALKVVAAILRDKPQVEIRESDVAYLLKRISPDLAEPDRQGLSFNFVKAVMARRMQLAELYELVDNIALMMVTSHSRSARDVARGVYVHFLLDYPQGKSRWSKQVKFLVKNLEYKHSEGRASVMEATNTLMTKVDSETASEIASVMFIPIVLRMANDDDEQCRQLAGALLSEIFVRASENFHVSISQTLRSWLDQSDNMALRKTSLQAWCLYLRAKPDVEDEQLVFLRGHVLQILESSQTSEEWELAFQALAVLRTLLDGHRQVVVTQKQATLWQAVMAQSRTPQPWLQISAFELISVLLQECAKGGQTSIPLDCGNGLSMDESQCVSLVRASVRALGQAAKSSTILEAVLPSLLYLARTLADNGAEMQVKAQPDTGADVQEATSGMDDETDQESGADESASKQITVTKYILDQSARILRREPPKHTAAALQPRIAAATLLQNLIPHLSIESLTKADASIETVLVPLLHLTSTTTAMPRSSDPTFSDTYQKLIEQCQMVLDVIQTKLGDQAYGTALTVATRQARARRQERRTKRAIATIAEPEIAAREKRRKFEKKKERRKEISNIHRKHRRRDLGF